jgi:hypothetical protein
MATQYDAVMTFQQLIESVVFNDRLHQLLSLQEQATAGIFVSLRVPWPAKPALLDKPHLP